MPNKTANIIPTVRQSYLFHLNCSIESERATKHIIHITIPPSSCAPHHPQCVYTELLCVYAVCHMNMQHANKSNQPTKHLVETFVNGIWEQERVWACCVCEWSILCFSVDGLCKHHRPVVCSGRTLSTFSLLLISMLPAFCALASVCVCWGAC